MLDDLEIFIVTAEQQSLTALEQQLGRELLQRSPQGVQLTPAGQAYYAQCASLIHTLSHRLTDLDSDMNGLGGPLTVLAPTNLGSGPLDEFWQQFCRRYPEIELRVQLASPSASVLDHNADIALRSGPQANSSLRQRRLGQVPLVLVAARDYPQPLPQCIEQLTEHASIAAELFSDWHLQQAGQTIDLHKQHRHISNNLQVILQLAKAGAGIALLPLSMAYSAIQQRQLQVVLPSWQGPARELYLVWPNQRSLSARARAFDQQLTSFLNVQPWFESL